MSPPGAESSIQSPKLLYDAIPSFLSVAETATTSSYPAGYSIESVSSLPAAAITNEPLSVA